MTGELELEARGLENPSDSDHLLPRHQRVDSESPSSSSPPPSAASSVDVKYEDVEEGSIANCRICLECNREEDSTVDLFFLCGVPFREQQSLHCSDAVWLYKGNKQKNWSLADIMDGDLTYGDSGTTSTLKRHLLICKPHKDYEEKQNLLNFPHIRSDGDAGHEKLPSLIRPDAKYDNNKMREAIATWVLGTEQPFSVMEDDLFVHMMKTTTPLFEKTSRTSTKSDCSKIYEHEKKTLKALIKAASKISLTTDCWKSSHQKIEYMVITGHFIDHNWRLQKRVFSFVHVPPPRTGLDIANDGLAMINSVIGEVREGIKYINNSEVRLQTFSNIAHQLQIQDRKLLLDVPTRWNSTYDMLSVALKFKDVFSRFSRYAQMSFLESDYPTSNLYLIEVFRVKETLDKGALSKNDSIRTMIRHRYGIKKKLKKEEMPIEVLLPTGTNFAGLNLLQGRLAFEF
ncbi:unnamed protein product [Lactuca virosa]|uniref:Uncharacterized protein n=1 Tax=Lactuca virosa TaxID=75947 RepID=A0AAU9M910_9ASTR|nr:unnamed protein product [Lactuca virosa]